MSFEVTARNLIDLFQLAWKVVDSCRQACGEKEPLTREVAGLFIVVSQLKQEAEKPSSSLHWQDDISRKELESTIYRCRKLLRAVDQVVGKYASSRRRGGSRKGLFKSVQFGNGEVLTMSDVIEELSVHKAALSLDLRLLTPSSRGSVEWPLGKKFPGMQQALHWRMAKISSSHDGSSLSSSYSDDERVVWKTIRRGLVRDGYSRRDIKKHRKAIKEYIKHLGWSDSFDEIPPSPNSAMQREPEDDYPRQPYTPEPYPQENFSHDSLPQQNYPPPPPPPPPGHFSQQNFPPQSYPPPPPPPSNFPPQNFPQQNFPQPIFQQQNFPPPQFSQQNYPPPPPPPLPHHFPRNFEPEPTPQQIYVIRGGSPESERGRTRVRSEHSQHVPSPRYVPPSVSDEDQEFDEKSDFRVPPPQNEPQFSVRPCDLSETFQCTEKDTWNDMMESLVTTLINTDKSLYFHCSICQKLTVTAQASLDRSQNWCRNCFLAIIYNVLYYPLVLPEWCKLRPISETRMQTIVTPRMKGLWVSSYDALRAMRGRPAGGMLLASIEEPPLLLYRYPAVQDQVSGKTMRMSYFEIAYFEEPFSSFVARRKQQV